MKKIKLLSILLALSTFAFAQTPLSLTGGSAAANFNGGSLDNGSGASLNTFPSGWGLAEIGSNANGFYQAGTGSSNSGDAYSFGMAASQERAFGGVASNNLQAWLGFAFTNNTGSAITAMNIAYMGEQWRAGDSNPLEDTLYFAYSLNATAIDDTAATWTYVSALDFISPNPTGGASTGALDGNLAANQSNRTATITANVGMGATVRFRWVDINIAGSDDGLAIDDFTMTVTTGTPLPPALLTTMPADNATNVPVTTTSLSLTLDQTITSLGTGTVQLIDITNSNTANIPAANISFSGAVLTVTGVTLASNTDYAVQITPNMLMTANGNYAGIVNNTTWNFKTENTAPPAAITMLNETFTNCIDPNFGLFSAYSELGGQDWRCTTFGHNDSNAVQINGYAGGAPRDNVDWLISPPLDFSNMLRPVLDFWSKLRFPANTTKELLISTNYSGTGSPTAASWQAVQINNWNALDTTWKQFTNTDLTSYKSGIFHIAFKYTSDTTDADEWSLDDIVVTDKPSSTSSFAASDLLVQVLGDVHGDLNLQSLSSQDRKLNFSIRDMAGRVITRGNLNVISGQQKHSLQIANLNSGMYFINISDDRARTSLKFIVK